MLAEYQKIFNTYATAFSEHGCTIKSGCGWSNLLKRNYSEERLPFRNGYACYIYCDVQRTEKSILYEDKEGEADYYEASASWSISSISRLFFHLNVTLWSDTDQIHEEMIRLLEIV